MKMSRRTVLRRMPAFTALAAGRRDFRANGDRTNAEPVSSTRQTQRGRLKRIATEEAFTIPELIEPMRDVLRRGGSNLDLTLLSTIYAEDATTSSIAQASAATSQNRGCARADAAAETSRHRCRTNSRPTEHRHHRGSPCRPRHDAELA